MARVLPALLLVLAATESFGAQAVPLRTGWVYVAGAQDLIQAGQWGCGAPGVTFVNGSLTVSPVANDFNTVVNTWGPTLSVSGDFSILATLSASPTSSAWLTLVGALPDDTAWWSGLKRLDIGLVNGSVDVHYWTGTSAFSTEAQFPLPRGTSNTTSFEVARIGTRIAVFVGGTQVATLADPGLFSQGRIYFGFNVAPTTVLNVVSLSAAMPAGSATALFVPSQQLAARTGSALRDIAEKSGFAVGAEVIAANLYDPRYAQTLGREYNVLVPGDALKWGTTEPAPHQFYFCDADELLQFAQLNAIQVRGHNLVWDENLPDWLTTGNYSPAQTADLLQEHINTLVGRYKGKLAEWDVVNEAVSDGPAYNLRPSYWLQQMGQSYIEQAFRWARAADPSAKLFYNDYGGEGLAGKSDAIYALVRDLVNRGVPIDGVGLQMHVALDDAPSQADLSANIARLGALGLEVHITEMDVRLPVDGTGKASAPDLAAQAVVYQNALAACRANQNCTAFLTWGFTDGWSWIPESFPGFGAALPFDAGYQPKSAYTSLMSVLRATASTPLPVISQGGVVIHAGTAATVSPGSLVDIYGKSLATATLTVSVFPVATQLGGVQVTVNGAPVPVYYVSPAFIIFQMPWETAPGQVTIRVTDGGAISSAATLNVQQAAPNILIYGNNQAVVTYQNLSVNSPTNCAAPGTVLTAWLIGSGPLDNAIATGALAPLAPISRETLTTTATVGGVNAPVTFAGMTPQSIGLMQVNFQAPKVAGNLPLQIQVGSFTSNQALVCVGP